MVVDDTSPPPIGVATVLQDVLGSGNNSVYASPDRTSEKLCSITGRMPRLRSGKKNRHAIIQRVKKTTEYEITGSVSLSRKIVDEQLVLQVGCMRGLMETHSVVDTDREGDATIHFEVCLATDTLRTHAYVSPVIYSSAIEDSTSADIPVVSAKYCTECGGCMACTLSYNERTEMLTVTNMKFGDLTTRAAVVVHLSAVLEGGLDRTTQMSAKSPKAAEYTFEGHAYHIPIDAAVWRLCTLVLDLTDGKNRCVCTFLPVVLCLYCGYTKWSMLPLTVGGLIFKICRSGFHPSKISH